MYSFIVQLVLISSSDKAEKLEDEPTRKRHVTEPSSCHGNPGDPGPSQRRRGTSLSITYADDGSDGEGEYPWYFKLELADRKAGDEDDNHSEVYSIQVGS